MRIVTAYLLRFLIDDDHPGRLHGTMQAVDGGEKLTFTDLEGLIELLRRIGPSTANPSQSPVPPCPSTRMPQ